MAEKVAFQSSFFFSSPPKSAVGAIITVTDADSGNRSTLFSDLAGSGTSANPSKLLSDSFFKTYLTPGRYNITVTDGFQSIELSDIAVGLDGGGIDDVSSPGDVAGGDFVIVYDASAEAFKKLALSSLQALQP